MKRFWACLMGMAFLVTLTVPAMADLWVEPKPRTYRSDNGRYEVKIIPAMREGKSGAGAVEAKRPTTPGATPQAKDSKCKAILYRIEGQKRVQLWETHLTNRVSPVQAKVSDDGRWVVTRDNWYYLGYGPDVVAIRGEGGRLVKALPLEALVSPAEMARIRETADSRWWLARSGFDERLGLYFVEIALPEGSPDAGRTIVLATGSVHHTTPREIVSALESKRLAAEPVLISLAENLRAREAIPILRMIARSPKLDLWRRVLAARALLSFGDKSGRFAVEQGAAMNGEPHVDMRSLALSLLPRVMGRDSLPILRHALVTAEYTPVKEAASRALVRLAAPGVAVLIDILKCDRDAENREVAAEALSGARGPKVLEALLAAATDPEEWVARRAIDAAINIGGSKLAPRLLRLLDEGCSADDAVVDFFTDTRYPAATPVLVRVLERSSTPRHGGMPARSERRADPDSKTADTSRRELQRDCVKALEFQTGEKLGFEARRWREYVRRTAAGECRGIVLAELGADDAAVRLAAEMGATPTSAQRALLWQTLERTPRLVAILPSDPKMEVPAIHFDGGRLISDAGTLSNLQAWDITSQAALLPKLPDARPVTPASMSGDGSRFAWLAPDGIHITETTTGTPVAPTLAVGSFARLALDHDGRNLAIAEQSQVRVIELQTEKERWRATIAMNDDDDLARFGALGRRVAFVDGAVVVESTNKIVLVDSGRTVYEGDERLDGVAHGALLLKKQREAFVVRRDGRKLGPFRTVADVGAIALSGDGQRVAVRDDDAVVQVYEISGRQIAVFPLEEQAYDVDLDAEGHLLAAQTDSYLNLFDVDIALTSIAPQARTRIAPQNWGGNDTSVGTVRFSQTGDRLAVKFTGPDEIRIFALGEHARRDLPVALEQVQAEAWTGLCVDREGRVVKLTPDELRQRQAQLDAVAR